MTLVVAAISAWTARETHRVHMHDLGKPQADAGRGDGPLVVLGTLAFGFQIYCDFSGYSDIAIGSARVKNAKPDGYTIGLGHMRRGIGGGQMHGMAAPRQGRQPPVHVVEELRGSDRRRAVQFVDFPIGTPVA